MDWKSVAGVLPAGLDLVGKVIGGPIGAVAQTGGTLLARALGADANPDSVAAAIQADPARAAEVIKAQLEHDAKIADLATQQTIALAQEDRKVREAELADIQSARQRDVQIIQATGHNWRADILAGGALVALIACAGIIAWVDMTDVKERLFSALMGALVVLNTNVFNFEFGGSRADRSGDEKSLMSELKKRAGL